MMAPHAQNDLHKSDVAGALNKGFTLIELLVAVLVFSIGIIGVAKMQSEAIRGNSFAMQMTRANNIAEDVAEYLKVLPFISTSLGGAAIPLPADVTIAANDVTSSGITYEREWIVRQVAGKDNLRSVSVEIWWQNREHSVALMFYKRQ